MSLTAMNDASRRTLVVDGLTTSFHDAGDGDAVVLIHGGEFGCNAEIAWEHTFEVLAERHRVIAPDLLGYGRSAKVVDLVDGRGLRTRHLARLCSMLDISEAAFVGNSMSASLLIADASSHAPVLRMSKLVAICGGGETLMNEHLMALQDYDGTFESMRCVVAALFANSAWAADDEYVDRRYQASLVPGAWEAAASMRLRRPGSVTQTTPHAQPELDRIGVPTLLVEGADDKLKPRGWSDVVRDQISGARSVVVPATGHCPHIESPSIVNDLLTNFLA